MKQQRLQKAMSLTLGTDCCAHLFGTTLRAFCARKLACAAPRNDGLIRYSPSIVMPAFSGMMITVTSIHRLLHSRRPT